MKTNRPLRFCHITTFYPPFSFGGDAVWVHRLANSLACEGHKVDVIHCIDSYNVLKSGDVPTQMASDNHAGVTVHGLKTGWGPVSPLASQQTGHTWPKTKQILTVLNSNDFDVIHYHNVSLFGPMVLELLPKRAHVVKLYTAHEYWLICPMHVLWKNNSAPCDSPECLACAVAFRRPPQLWRYTHLLERCAEAVDIFLAPSRFARDLHSRRGFKKPMEHLPFFARRATETVGGPSPHPRPYFLYAGRLEALKGLQDVINVFREYRAADLLVAGAGTYEPELRRLADTCDHIHFLGWTSGDRLLQLYAHAIAVIVPSLCYEIFPLTTLEAFACRTPVIARARGALLEIIEDSNAGIIFSTANELVDAMEKLRQDQSFRCHLGENGHNQCATCWSERTHLDHYLNMITECAQAKWGASPGL